MITFPNKLYQDRKWLETKYNKEKLSDREIAKLLKVNYLVIWKWRKKFKIAARTRGEVVHLSQGNHCILSREALEWINGELLGDGCLQSYSRYSASFFYSSKYLEYVQYVSNTLKSFGITQCGKIRKYYLKDRKYYFYQYNSHCYEELLSIRKKWYSNKRKIVPRDIELSILTCRQWYIGDGCLSHSSTSPNITIGTCGFPITDVIWLKDELNKLGFKVTREPSVNQIHISVYSTKDFLNYIGTCPVKCYEYKWNLKGDKSK